jgi:hypothetical protein
MIERAPLFRPANLLFFFPTSEIQRSVLQFPNQKTEPLFLFHSSEPSLAHNHFYESSFTTFLIQIPAELNTIAIAWAYPANVIHSRALKEGVRIVISTKAHRFGAVPIKTFNTIA